MGNVSYGQGAFNPGGISPVTYLAVPLTLLCQPRWFACWAVLCIHCPPTWGLVGWRGWGQMPLLMSHSAGIGAGCRDSAICRLCLLPCLGCGMPSGWRNFSSKSFNKRLFSSVHMPDWVGCQFVQFSLWQQAKCLHSVHSVCRMPGFFKFVLSPRQDPESRFNPILEDPKWSFLHYTNMHLPSFITNSHLSPKAQTFCPIVQTHIKTLFCYLTPQYLEFSSSWGSMHYRPELF